MLFICFDFMVQEPAYALEYDYKMFKNNDTRN